MVEARQLASTKIMPTERSSPPVSTGSVCAMATRASSAPLLAAVLTISALRPDRLRQRRRRRTSRRRSPPPAVCRAVPRASSASRRVPSLPSPLLAQRSFGSLLRGLVGRPADVQSSADQVMLVQLGSLQHPGDRAVVEDGDAVAAADQLVIVGRVEEDRRAFRGKAAQQLVDFLFGADVDARGLGR